MLPGKPGLLLAGQSSKLPGEYGCAVSYQRLILPLPPLCSHRRQRPATACRRAGGGSHRQACRRGAAPVAPGLPAGTRQPAHLDGTLWRRWIAGWRQRATAVWSGRQPALGASCTGRAGGGGSCGSRRWRRWQWHHSPTLWLRRHGRQATLGGRWGRGRQWRCTPQLRDHCSPAGAPGGGGLRSSSGSGSGPSRGAGAAAGRPDCLLLRSPWRGGSLRRAGAALPGNCGCSAAARVPRRAQAGGSAAAAAWWWQAVGAAPRVCRRRPGWPAIAKPQRSILQASSLLSCTRVWLFLACTFV